MGRLLLCASQTQSNAYTSTSTAFSSVEHQCDKRLLGRPADRERAGREASPTAAIIDSQSVKTTESGGPCGYDAGKKVKGRKRRVLVDTDGRALLVEPHPADIQDQDAGGPLLQMA